ncbi:MULTISPECIES: DUF4332 domain-containing protein [Gordonibacter]|uniref:DUF4332 domain-containing protein n=1 Tax=Gordonibacter faecis TaxID=3047475 RepID=A0ABT7DMB0_9ACTN|nr:MULTISPECIES: DUF4332 domain-containing protein [unclassified Gordonibacter]MDJ1650655.1 DUF4332 domain-containing protein [Gordonibacter sp. KGMB12511]HIW75823.1 DUF4332 domain-containing protein [Candidatus Gordonibacter avicola]
MANDIASLFGMDPEAAEKIKAQGIETIEAFYEVAKHPDTRADLSEKIGVDTFKLEEWSATAGNFILMSNCEW